MRARVTTRGLARRTRAFTLIEMITVMVIVGILAALALPRLANSTALHRASLAAQRVTTDLELARQNARMTSASQTIKFDAATDRYQLASVAHLARSSADFTVDLSLEPYNADIAAVDFGGDAELVFDAYGIPDSGGSITVQSGVHAQSITLDADSGETKTEATKAVSAKSGTGPSQFSGEGAPAEVPESPDADIPLDIPDEADDATKSVVP